MTSSTTSPISSVRQLNISSLPDLPLLVVFDHLPLLDLFNIIPLVCSRWTTLQALALKRRTKLLLFGSEYIKCRKDLVNDLATLPLPSTHHGWTTGTGGRLLRPEAAEWLWNKLPNITKLVIFPYFSIVSYGLYNEDRITIQILEQAVRLVTRSQRWCSQLTTLKLNLVNRLYHEYPVYLTDEVIKAINQRMPCLTVLHLIDLPNKPSVPLASQTLTRLRYLAVYRNPDWLWQSLCSVTKPPNQLQSPFSPDLHIEFQWVSSPTCLIQQPNLPVLYDHIRALVLGTSSYNDGVNMALHLIPERFHALRSLKLSISGGMVEDDPWRVLATALRCLAPLTSLMRLEMVGFHLLPVDGGQVREEQLDSKMALPSLQVLELSSFNIRSHSDLGKALDWSHCFPRLRRLALSGSCRTICQQCQSGNAPINYVSVASFFLSGECRRLAFEPLEACLELNTIELDNYRGMYPQRSRIGTRTDMSAPFQWSQNE